MVSENFLLGVCMFASLIQQQHTAESCYCTFRYTCESQHSQGVSSGKFIRGSGQCVKQETEMLVMTYHTKLHGNLTQQYGTDKPNAVLIMASELYSVSAMRVLDFHNICCPSLRCSFCFFFLSLSIKKDL